MSTRLRAGGERRDVEKNPKMYPGTQTALGPNDQLQAKSAEARLSPSYDDDDEGKGDCHKVMSGGVSRK